MHVYCVERRDGSGPFLNVIANNLHEAIEVGKGDLGLDCDIKCELWPDTDTVDVIYPLKGGMLASRLYTHKEWAESFNGPCIGYNSDFGYY